MTIGLIIHFFDFRNDVREMIQHLLGEGHKVVVFYKQEQEVQIMNHPIDGVEYRLIQERHPSLRNRIWEYLFLFFKQLPKSRNNYFLMELFKNNNIRKGKYWNISDIALWVQKSGFNFISFDSYVRHLVPSCRTNIDGVDKFIGFTEFPCDYLAARLIKGKHPFEVYVYSWDHPFKHTRFSKHYCYMAWSESVKLDICEMQKIEPSKVRVIGATQFTYIDDFKKLDKMLPRPYEFKYIYYCCAIGIHKLVPEEIAIISNLAKILKEFRPDWKLIVRPYPILSSWGMYDGLRQINNVQMDDAFRGNTMGVQKNNVYDKLNKLDYAEAVLHTGSTIGVEASFFKGGTFLVDFGYKHKRGLSVYNFIHQAQNEKYLVNTFSSGSIKSEEEFIAILDCKKYNINKELSKLFPLRSMNEIVNDLVSPAKCSL